MAWQPMSSLYIEYKKHFLHQQPLSICIDGTTIATVYPGENKRMSWGKSSSTLLVRSNKQQSGPAALPETGADCFFVITRTLTGKIKLTTATSA